MKLLFMIPRLSYTGAPKMMAWVANEMCSFGHEVKIVSMYKSENQQSLNKKINFVSLSHKQSKNWLYRNTIGMLKVIRNYRKEVKDFKPDVIISFLDSVSYFYIFLNHFFWHEKILVSERVDPYSRHGLRAKVCFKILSLGDYVVFQTDGAKNFFGHKYDKNSMVIGNPVVLNESSIKAISIKNSKNFKRNKVISVVGRLSLIQKRQDIAIQAFSVFKKSHADYKLHIYGSGNDEQSIRSFVEKYDLNDDVVFLGQQDNIPEKIVNSACFILTSDFEGIPNALIEAMSIGIPSISTDCSPGGAKLLINDGVNGFLVKKGDFQAIADKLSWIVENQDKSEKIGREAMKIAQTFSEKEISIQWEQAIKNAR